MKKKVVIFLIMLFILVAAGCSDASVNDDGSNNIHNNQSNESINIDQSIEDSSDVISDSSVNDSDSNDSNNNQSNESINIDQSIEDSSDVIENKLYQVFIYDFSNSVPSAKHEFEYEFADYDKYNNQTVNTHIEYSINGKSFSGDFQSRQYREYNYFPVSRYVGDEGVLFEIDEFGVLTSCFWGNTSESSEKKEEECIEIAKDFLANIVDISDYDIAVEYEAERGLYTVKFTKSINGIKTSDAATIVVKNDGNLYSYSSFMLGRVKKESILFDTIDIYKVKESIDIKLNQIYQDSKSIYSRIDYGEPDIMLTILKDGSAGVICTVNVECVKIVGEFETSVSERISFVVMDNK